MLLKYDGKNQVSILDVKYIYISLLNSKIKIIAIYYHNQLYLFYLRILPYHFIARYYDIIHHVKILDLDLVQFY